MSNQATKVKAISDLKWELASMELLDDRAAQFVPCTVHAVRSGELLRGLNRVGPSPTATDEDTRVIVSDCVHSPYYSQPCALCCCYGPIFAFPTLRKAAPCHVLHQPPATAHQATNSQNQNK